MAKQVESQPLLNLPPAADVSLSATGSEVAIATPFGALLGTCIAADRPIWTSVRSPEGCQAASCVAFHQLPASAGNTEASSAGWLAVASKRQVYVVDTAASPTECGSTAPGRGQQGDMLHDPKSELGAAGTVMMTSPRQQGSILCINWCQQSPSCLALGTQDGKVVIWDTRLAQLSQVHSLPHPVTCIRWSPWTGAALAAGHDGQVAILDIRCPLSAVTTLAPGQGHVVGVDWAHHASNTLLSVSYKEDGTSGPSGSIKIWDLQSRELNHYVLDGQGIPSCAKFVPNMPAVLAAMDEQVQLLEIPGSEESISSACAASAQQARELQRFRGHEAMVTSLDLAVRDDEVLRLATVSRCERVLRLWRYMLPHESMLDKSLPVQKADKPAQLQKVSSSSRWTEENEEALEKCVASLRELQAASSASLEIVKDSCPTAAAGGKLMCRIHISFVSEYLQAATLLLDTEAATDSFCGDVAGVSLNIDWPDGCSYKSLDGPLAPGTVSTLFMPVRASQLLAGDSMLVCQCFEALLAMLQRAAG